MREPLTWNQCRQFVRKADPDRERARSLLTTARKRLLRTQRQPFLEDEVSFAIEDRYEVLKELLTAFLLTHGLRSSNHQCLIAFFREQFPGRERDADLLGLLCYRRNRLEYYGERLEPAFYRRHIASREELISFLEEATERLLTS